MSNIKEKTKHLPINLLINLCWFGFIFSIFSKLQDDNCLSFLIASVMYINNVVTDSRFDYLNEQVEKLKSKNDT
jgi:hypothetical protein